MLPVAYYRTAFEAIEAMRPSDLEVRHAIQTNGMLITPEWCELFREWHVGVGVSIDGPQRLHDAHRVTRSGRGTFDKTLAGIRLLRQEGVPFHVISVLSKDSMDAPEEMLAFYQAEGIEDVCFNVEESEGDHVSALLTAADPKARFHAFLDRFWTLARQSPQIGFIREIDALLPRIFRPEGTAMTNPQVEPFGMVNVDVHGNVSSFSPELLGYKDADYSDFIIGNVNRDTLQDMRASAAMKAMTRDVEAGVEMCRQECEYFSVCGGGSPVNKLSENGRFASSKTSFCTLVQMVPTDIILGALDQLERAFEDGTAPLPAHATIAAFASTGSGAPMLSRETPIEMPRARTETA